MSLYYAEDDREVENPRKGEICRDSGIPPRYLSGTRFAKGRLLAVSAGMEEP